MVADLVSGRGAKWSRRQRATSAELRALTFDQRCDGALLLRRYVRGDAGRKFFQRAVCRIGSAALDVPECRDIQIEQQLASLSGVARPRETGVRKVRQRRPQLTPTEVDDQRPDRHQLASELGQPGNLL